MSVPDLERARETVEASGNHFNAELCSRLVEQLDHVSGALLVTWAETLPETPNGVWLRTQFLIDSVRLAREWKRFVSFGVRRDPLDLLAWSRALAASGAHEEAAQRLRLALTRKIGPAFFARAEKLVSTLSDSVKSNVRQSKIAVLGSGTTHFLVQMLKALCFRDQINAEIYEAPYGSIEQEIRGEDTGLARFRPDIVILMTQWRDLHLEAVTSDEQAWIDHFIEERTINWTRLAEAFSCYVIQPSFDYPGEEAYGHLSGVLPGGRSRMIDLLNLRLREAAPANVSILNMAAVQRDVGTRRWEDERGWACYRQHPSMEALPEVAEALMAHVRAVLGLSRKVLVTDLDNTLWAGVIGEDGLDGIRIGPDSPEGEAHLHLQHYLLDLKRRGILLVVCSKNNLVDAQLPFRLHAHMALRLEDFSAFRANWEDKAANLRSIARELSLGLDSFVFLDDNSLEREWVRSQLPEVAVVELGSSPFHFLRELDRGRHFEALSLSGEDLVRANQYRTQAQRENLRGSAGSLDDFLKNLQLEACVEEVTQKNLVRVTQLMNKTNQFNVTTRRYTEAQVSAFVKDSHAWSGAFQLSDRMGGYGLIGVLLCKAVEGDWEIDSWLMSCRTLGRQMEKFMFDRMVEAAVARGIKTIWGVYRPTAKNGLVKELYDELGFRRVSELADEVRYELDVPLTFHATATHVLDASIATAMVT